MRPTRSAARPAATQPTAPLPRIRNDAVSAAARDAPGATPAAQARQLLHSACEKTPALQRAAFWKEYVEAMRSVQPRGPYCLGGMCEGALIAQQIIVELESQGESVGLFAVFDTWVLENSQIRLLWAIDYYLNRFRLFRRQSRQQQLAMVQRSFRRFLRPDQANGGSGWKQVYWPAHDFQAPRFRAPVLLFKRPRQPYYYIRDRKMGWGARSQGGVEICEINFQHAEVLRQPHVRIIGERLASRLQRIRESESRLPSDLNLA